MKARTAGFTMLELLLVLAVASVIGLMAFPRIQRAVVTAALRSAKQTTASYLVLARAAAIQSGQQVTVVRVGDTLKVTIDSSGRRLALAPVHDLRAEQGISLTPSRDTFAFDPRGFAVGLGSLEKIRFSRSGRTDSVCVTRRGRISQGCTP